MVKNIYKLRFLLALTTLLACTFLASNALHANNKAAIAIDFKTGRVYHSQNENVALHPVSLTKMMTLFLVLEKIQTGQVSWNTKIRVSKHATRTFNFKLNLKAGSRISLRDAVLAMMVKSANDTAIAIGEHLGQGSEAVFARNMTQKARALGMNNTNFVNASGVPDPRQVTTARDMAILTQALYKKFPQYKIFYGAPSFQFNGRTYKNSNKLLGSLQGIDGGKTGYSLAARHNLAVSADRNGNRIIAVVMVCKSAQWRDKKMADLVEATYQTIAAEKANPRLKPSARQLPQIVLAKNVQSSTSSTGHIILAKNEQTALSIPQEYFEPEQASLTTTNYNVNTLSADSPRLSKTTWSIQVGAYRHSKEAFNAASKALTLMPASLQSNVRVIVSPTPKGKRRVYRARLVGFSKDQALKVCKKLETKGNNCLPIQPQKSQKLYTAMK